MKNYCYHVGIDISKLKLDVNLLNVQTLKSEHFVTDNNPKAIKSFIKLLIKRKIDVGQVLFCCENTGIYTNHVIHTMAELKFGYTNLASSPS